MFGLQRQIDDLAGTPSAVEQRNEALRAKLELPRNNGLLLAQQNLAKLRADRRELDSQRTAIIHAQHQSAKPDGNDLRYSPEYVDLTARIDRLSDQITKARAERDAQRDAYGAKARESIAPGVTEFRDAILQELNALEELIAVGIDLYATSADGGFELQNSIRATPALRECIRSMRAMLR